MPVMTYLDAIRQGIWEEMERDPSVFLLGEDIGDYGGAFKVTAGMLKKFGAERVIDTPISESAIVGAAVGAALMGMRPVAEMQFMDFISCGFDQIVNMAAKIHYRWGAKVPLVIRGPSGAGEEAHADTVVRAALRGARLGQGAESLPGLFLDRREPRHERRVFGPVGGRGPNARKAPVDALQTGPGVEQRNQARPGTGKVAGQQ